MVAIVLVSHSCVLAEAARDMACRIAGKDIPIFIAAGNQEDSGTDAAAIAKAITQAGDYSGIVVITDHGNAVFNTELAVQLVDPLIASRVRLTRASLVEGLIAASMRIASGDDLAGVLNGIEEAMSALLAGHIVRLQADDSIEPSGQHAVIWRTTVHNEHGIHIRPAASIVTSLRECDAHVLLSNATTGTGPVVGTSLSKILTLAIRRGDILQAKITGCDAEKARQILAHLAARHFGESEYKRVISPVQKEVEPSRRHDHHMGRERMCVIGPVSRRTSRPMTADYHPASPKVELERFTQASEQVAAYLESLSLSGQTGAGIVEAQYAMVQDRELHHDIVSRITEGFSAVDAIDECLSIQARSFDLLTDSYMRERGQDLRSIRRLLLLAIMGRPLSSMESNGSIWLVDQIDAPSIIALNPQTVSGIMTLSGGEYGHGVLSARARGIPVLAGYREADRIADGQIIAFDPLTREVWEKVDDSVRSLIERRNRDRREAIQRAYKNASHPAVTSEGKRIEVLANIASEDDVRTAIESGAEGIGIIRTELLFASYTHAPSVNEQADIYMRIASLMSPKAPITIRTWDIGADKSLPFMTCPPELNPALGDRGLRAMRGRLSLFKDQLQAISIASQQINAQILIPMVSTPDELRWVRSLLDEVCREIDIRPPKVGMMIEVPATAIRVRDFADLIDFASIGTNDLSQYLYAADRLNPNVRDFNIQHGDAMLDVIGLISSALEGKAVTVCGDIASDPRHIAALLECGIDSVSVIPPMVASVKEAIRMS